MSLTIEVEVDAGRWQASAHISCTEQRSKGGQMEFSLSREMRSASSEPMKTIYILTTGGTIEKAYSEQTGSVANIESKIDRYLQSLRLPDAAINIVPLMNKDSLEMTDKDRVLLLGMVRAILNENAPLVITHGTDTMVQSGRYLERALPDLQVPIVMTGAMTPLGFEGSDGLQNLTESLLAVRLLTPGIYVAMHGQIFPVSRVQKDNKLMRFVWTENPGS
jgi:L-asparaginase